MWTTYKWEHLAATEVTNNLVRLPHLAESGFDFCGVRGTLLRWQYRHIHMYSEPPYQVVIIVPRYFYPGMQLSDVRVFSRCECH